MAFYLKQENKGLDPAPEGVHNAVCIDVVDLGIVPTMFGNKHRLRIVFELEETMPDGRPFYVSQTFSASLHPRAQLNAFLSKWRGKPIAEGEQIDLEKCIGTSALLVISHNQSQDGTKTYANIDAVSRPQKKITPSGAYDPDATRRRIMEKAQQASAPARPAQGIQVPQRRPLPPPVPQDDEPEPEEPPAAVEDGEYPF